MGWQAIKHGDRLLHGTNAMAIGVIMGYDAWHPMVSRAIWLADIQNGIIQDEVNSGDGL